MRPVVFAACLACLVAACGGKTPTAPTPSPAVTPPVTSQHPNVSVTAFGVQFQADVPGGADKVNAFVESRRKGTAQGTGPVTYTVQITLANTGGAAATVGYVDLYLLDVKLPPGTLPLGKVPKFSGRVVAADDARFTMTIAYQDMTDADRALAGQIASAIAAQSSAPPT